MFRLSKKIEFCLMILKHFSKEFSREKDKNLLERDSSHLSSAFFISKKYGISLVLTQKMLQKLKQKNILGSLQGTKGGYRLLKDLSTVSFLDLMEIIEGEVNVVRCLKSSNGKSICSYSAGCEIIGPMRGLNLKLRNFYSEILLSDLVSLSLKPRSKAKKKSQKLEKEKIYVAN